MEKRKYLTGIAVILVSLFLSTACSSESSTEPANEEAQQNANNNEDVASTNGETTQANPTDLKMELTMEDYNPPSMDDVPEGPLGEAIKYGYQLMNETNELMDEHVGNELSCSSCHGNAGLDMTSSFVGVTTVFPQYRAREAVVFTIEDRINGCMKRSMNGKPIPYDSTEMRAMVSYLNYISEGIPVGAEIPWRMLNTMKDAPTPDLENGEKLYAQSCASCHGADGSGIGPNNGPAVWGPNSYNDGAGMARMVKAAGYIKNNMPLVEMGGINQGELTDQQAADLAGFINSHERPKWEGRADDWPKGGAPKDVPYFDEIESMKK